MIAAMTGDPVPVLVESGSDIAALLRGHMDALRITHKIIDLIRQAEYFIVIGTHTFGHQPFVNTDHVSVAHFKFCSQERQQRDAERDLTRLRGGDIVCYAGTCLDE